MRKYELDNNIILYIGNNANENWVLLSNSKPWYIFLHLSSFPSCYGIINKDKDVSVDKLCIYKSCKLVLDNTKYRNMKNVKVDITECDNIKKGNLVGEVIYKSNKKIKTIYI